LLGSKRSVKYVMPFKNEGMRIGVSMTHPRSQLYALPFIPHRIRREIASAKIFATRYRQNLFDEAFRRDTEEKSIDR